MTIPQQPWSPGFIPAPVDPQLIQQITGAIEGAVGTATDVATSVGSEVAGQVAGQAAAQAVQDVGQVASTAEKTVESVIPTSLPPVGVPGVPNDWITAIEKQAVASAEAAYKAALPELQGRIVTAASNALQAELARTLGPAQTAVLPTGKDLTKLDAWERAGRTFLMGLVTVLLASIIQVIGAAASTGTVDFFTTDGWKSVAVLGGGTIVTSIFSYLYRYVKEPEGAAIDSSTKA